MAAFFRLSSCRSLSPGIIGPIPWNRIIDYGSRKGLDDVMMQVFEDVIWELDGIYREWHQAQAQAKK
jgi:hypothetical protein